MSKLTIPKNYSSALNLHDTQLAIKTVKDFFQGMLAQRLSLTRVSAPLFVDPTTGLNDNLNGYERPVTFGILEQGDKEAEVVHSLAKWKRYALKKYGFSLGEGIYTDMNAIRRDEETDNIHSIFVDQWDWEKIIRKEDRNLDFLEETVHGYTVRLHRFDSAKGYHLYHHIRAGGNVPGQYSKGARVLFCKGKGCNLCNADW